jgi:hypothetical protein
MWLTRFCLRVRPTGIRHDGLGRHHRPAGEQVPVITGAGVSISDTNMAV